LKFAVISQWPSSKLAQYLNKPFLRYVQSDVVDVELRVRVLLALCAANRDVVMDMNQDIHELLESCDAPEADEWVRVISSLTRRRLFPDDNKSIHGDKFESCVQEVYKVLNNHHLPPNGETSQQSFSLPLDAHPTNWPYLAKLPSDFILPRHNPHFYCDPLPIPSLGMMKNQATAATMTTTTTTSSTSSKFPPPSQPSSTSSSTIVPSSSSSNTRIQPTNPTTTNATATTNQSSTTKRSAVDKFYQVAGDDVSLLTDESRAIVERFAAKELTQVEQVLCSEKKKIDPTTGEESLEQLFVKLDPSEWKLTRVKKIKKLKGGMGTTSTSTNATLTNTMQLPQSSTTTNTNQ
jgi:hypothetical protein